MQDEQQREKYILNFQKGQKIRNKELAYLMVSASKQRVWNFFVSASKHGVVQMLLQTDILNQSRYQKGAQPMGRPKQQESITTFAEVINRSNSYPHQSNRVNNNDNRLMIYFQGLKLYIPDDCQPDTLLKLLQTMKRLWWNGLLRMLITFSWRVGRLIFGNKSQDWLHQSFFSFSWIRIMETMFLSFVIGKEMRLKFCDTTGMVVSLKTDLRFPIPGQQGHGGRIIQWSA